MADKTIICKDCGKEFVFTEGEQEFYKEKGFQNDPFDVLNVEERKKNATEEIMNKIFKLYLNYA